MYIGIDGLLHTIYAYTNYRLHIRMSHLVSCATPIFHQNIITLLMTLSLSIWHILCDLYITLINNETNSNWMNLYDDLEMMIIISDDFLHLIKGAVKTCWYEDALGMRLLICCASQMNTSSRVFRRNIESKPTTHRPNSLRHHQMFLNSMYHRTAGFSFPFVRPLALFRNRIG